MPEYRIKNAKTIMNNNLTLYHSNTLFYESILPLKKFFFYQSLFPVIKFLTHSLYAKYTPKNRDGKIRW